MSDLKLNASLESMGGKDRIAAPSGYNDPGTYGMRMTILSISVSYQF
jgi:hypothetical protein